MENKLEKIVSLCKRRGFIFPSSEIYGGFAATYDYGPRGFLLKKNIEKAWRVWNVESRDDMVEIEGAIFMHPKVWEASGHIGGFSDPLVECKKCHQRFREDQIEGTCPNCGNKEFTESKQFNLLVKTHLGPVEDETSVAYLKGESCQNIYVDYKAVLDSMHLKLPFGIAQIGKAFRNEITVNRFLFRTREFEQMDTQYFCRPEDADKYYDEWKQNRWDFYANVMGFSSNNVKWRQHDADERAFYAKDAWDVQYNFAGMGFQEIEGVHHRGSYDLDQHSKFSGQDLTYFDQETGERFNPFIIECSGGFNRLFLATLFEFYHEEAERVVLKFPAKLAPYKAAVFPLLKNKPELVGKAREIYDSLRKEFSVAWDDRGNIGKRYYSQDEIGTMLGITADYETLENNTVTIRDRDTAKQIRAGVEDLADIIKKVIEGDDLLKLGKVVVK